jgi:hypothetical protein
LLRRERIVDLVDVEFAEQVVVFDQLGQCADVACAIGARKRQAERRIEQVQLILNERRGQQRRLRIAVALPWPKQHDVDRLLPAELGKHPGPMLRRAVSVDERLPRVVDHDAGALLGFVASADRGVELNVAHDPVE